MRPELNYSLNKVSRKKCLSHLPISDSFFEYSFNNTLFFFKHLNQLCHLSIDGCQIDINNINRVLRP